MPLYEYRCGKCDHLFEKIQKFSDKPRAKCPECGGAGKRQLSAPAIHFKGSGWYITDYARKGQTDPEKGAAKEESKKTGDAKKDSAGAAGKNAKKPAKKKD